MRVLPYWVKKSWKTVRFSCSWTVRSLRPALFTARRIEAGFFPYLPADSV
jgi:hypothetical protein